MNVRTYKYRLKDRSATRALLGHAYACNQVWNWCVAEHRHAAARYRLGAASRKWLSGFDLGSQCKGVGAMLGIHQQTVASICNQFARSRDQRRRCPKFRPSFGPGRASGWIPFQPQSRQISGNSVTYLGRRIRFFGSKRRPLPQNAKSGFFVEDASGRWFVCFHVEVKQTRSVVGGEIGLDLGIRSLAVLSNGEVVENPRHLQCYAEKLAEAQRAGNRRRANAIHVRIRNSRNDFHHKISTNLAARYALIVAGNVNAEALARTNLAKSVRDAGWSAFRNMLRYKAVQFVEVDERFTTQTCSSCGALPPERPRGIAGLGVRVWRCSLCGASHDRDVNAARNILALGRSVTPLVEESRSAA